MVAMEFWVEILAVAVAAVKVLRDMLRLETTVAMEVMDKPQLLLVHLLTMPEEVVVEWKIVMAQEEAVEVELVALVGIM
jgi:hypothetical protein